MTSVESPDASVPAAKRLQTAPKTILFCTSNANKLREVKAVLEHKSLGQRYLVDNADIDVPEFQGSAEEITAAKCKAAFAALKQPVLVEDTSLRFNALNGMPGPYIKWFLTAMGVEQLPKLLAGFDDKSAAALCIFGYWDGTPGTEPQLMIGQCDGKIVEPRGGNKFGWDPIFEPTAQPEGCAGMTFAELNTEQKASISHRGLGLKKLQDFMESNSTK
eukprot:Selendium_serpulae@DN4289_c0_g1_i1.p2